MKCKELFQIVEELFPYYLDVLEDVCNLESPTGNKLAVDAVGNYIATHAKERGWKIETYSQKHAGNVLCITLCDDAPNVPICLSGHIDTVHPIGCFGTPAVQRDAVNMYGPGVMDCKGGVVAAMLAMDALMRCGFSKRPVKLLIQTDEETSSITSNKATINYICAKAKDSIAFLNLEGAEGDTAVIQRKGIYRCKFIINGKACHSSGCYDGTNAITEAAHKIIQLEKFKDPNGITCNCGVITGGTVVNVVPDKCEFLADFRFSNMIQFEEIKKFVYHITKTNFTKGCTCTVEEISFRPAMEASTKNVELLKRMNEIYCENNLPILEARPEPSGSDAAYITQCGIPCVDNLGTSGGRIHSTDEYITLRSLAESAKRIAAVVYEI